jgi:multiple sugar transport system substrate-binding protein
MKKIWVLSVFVFFILLFGILFKNSIYFKDLFNPNPCVLMLASSGDDKVSLTNLLDSFHKTHPDIKVELYNYPYADYFNKPINNVTDKPGPDIVYVFAKQFESIYSQNILEPLDGYIAVDQTYPIKDFYPSIIDYFTIDGHLYVAPIGISTNGILYYNKNAFDAAKLAYPNDSWNWSDFLASARKLTVGCNKSLSVFCS